VVLTNTQQGAQGAPASDGSTINGVSVDQFVSVADTIQPTVTAKGRPRVVVIGGGFAGLNVVKSLKDADVEITLVDRRNHHLFAPLLYQVATAQLSPANIAQPIRGILKGQDNVKVLMDEATNIDVDRKLVSLASGIDLPYEYLVVAVGATHSYFGHDEWAADAPGLKTLEDALTIRQRILLAFEEAERELDPAKHQALLTFIIIGGGPTGVELAGAIGEIAHHTLPREFDHINPADARIILLEGLPRILPMFPEKLSERAKKDLEKFGVQTRTNSLVTNVDDHGVNIGEERIDASTVIWAAGVQVSPLTRSLKGKVELDRAGRVPVERELHVAGHPEVFVIGDAAGAKTAEGKPLPGVAPVAMQEGRWVAENIKRATRGEAYTPFQYNDKGSMATIGRNQAVANVKGMQFAGFPAWVMWALVHVAYLVGFRNRMLVMAQWLFSYFRYNRHARLITGEQPQHYR
jgi:NADH dehydrogenase